MIFPLHYTRMELDMFSFTEKSNLRIIEVNNLYIKKIVKLALLESAAWKSFYTQCSVLNFHLKRWAHDK